MALFSSSILEYLIDGAICVDREGRITLINQTACELLKTSAARVNNKKLVSEILKVDGAPYDLNLTKRDDANSQIGNITIGSGNPTQARVVTIPFSVTQTDVAVIVIKDLSHEEELFQKYQSQMRMKDQKIHESQLINSILQSIRLTKDPHSMVRQIALALIQELNAELSVMVTFKSQQVSCDIVTTKQHRSKYISLLATKTIPRDRFRQHSNPIECFNRDQLPAPLDTLWPTSYVCRVELYEGSEPIFLLIALESVPNQDKLSLISSIRDQTSLSISSSHFEKLSHIDELTSVYNRRYFIQQSSVFLRASMENGTDCSVILMDIDHFKRINDNEGHLFGDEVLRIFGQLLQNTTRVSDIVARYGGEEFVLFLPETNTGEASFLAERIRTILEKNEIAKGKSLRLVTASFGIASRIQTGATEIERLIEYADQALYVSKETGRNKVTVYSPKSSE
jgi:diguanylate cyclase (GGDEF)-like protein